MKKRWIGAAGAAILAAAALAGCSSSGSGDDSAGKVYYLNFKPEVTDVWEEIAQVYTEETGVEVKVVTAAGGNYESTLKSEIAKTDAPTLFQINGPVGYQSWKDYCLDLTDTEFYKSLSDQSLAVTGDDGGVYGIPYTVEGYGIIYNGEIMDKYFAMDGAKADSIEAIDSFDTLKAVVEDMQSKKDALGIKGVFASTLGNIAPFTTFSDEERPSDPLAQALLTSMESGKESIPWIFTAFPSQTFKDNFGSALLEYAQGTMDWEQVKQTVIEQWQIEKEAAK